MKKCPWNNKNRDKKIFLETTFYNHPVDIGARRINDKWSWITRGQTWITPHVRLDWNIVDNSIILAGLSGRDNCQCLRFSKSSFENLKPIFFNVYWVAISVRLGITLRGYEIAIGSRPPVHHQSIRERRESFDFGLFSLQKQKKKWF